MKRFILLMLVLSLTTLSWAGTRENDRLNKAGEVLTEIMNTPDKGIPEEVINAAQCIAVVPGLVKGAFIFGGRHGRGVATCRTASGWSAPAFISVSGGSWGMQIGGQSIDLIMMIMNDHGMERMLSNKFQVGGDASAVAGPVGRHASAGTDWKADSQILTYSRSKGLFAGIALTGAWVQQDKNAIRKVYGKNIDQRKLLSGSVATPGAASAFMTAIRNSSAQARVAGE
jgi:SH3 domain-containing YSC84-like protein 1